MFLVAVVVSSELLYKLCSRSLAVHSPTHSYLLIALVTLEKASKQFLVNKLHNHEMVKYDDFSDDGSVGRLVECIRT
jgi:hypothetical protein